jgi:hypothetical protein
MDDDDTDEKSNDDEEAVTGIDRPFQRFLKPGRRRRRRKRSMASSSSFQPAEVDFSCDAATLRRLWTAVDPPSTTRHHQKWPSSLPGLLFERELFGPHGARCSRLLQQPTVSWQQRLLKKEQPPPQPEEESEELDDSNDNKKNKTDRIRSNSSTPRSSSSSSAVVVKKKASTAADGGWRPYCRVHWKFRDLATSVSDAVLALNAHGTMLIALHCASSSLSLRVYGVPAKTARVVNGHGQKKPATLLLALPLHDGDCSGGRRGSAGRGSGIHRIGGPLYHRQQGEEDENLDGDDDDDSYLLSSWTEFDVPAPARVPVRIWWTTDGRIGVVMYRPKTDGLATFCVFSTTTAGSIHTTNGGFCSSWRLRNIHVPCQHRLDVNAANDGSFLWNVDYIPCHDDDDDGYSSVRHATNDAAEAAFLCRSWTRMPAHLLLIDEGDGFRMAWIRDAAWIGSNHETTTASTKQRREAIQRLWAGDDDDNNHNNARTFSESDVNSSNDVVRSNESTRIVVRIPECDSEWIRDDDDPVQQRSPAAVPTTTGRTATAAGLHMAYHAFFSTSALLHSLLSRNPRLVSPKFDASTAVLPNFDYHVVQVTDNRIVELFVIFSVGPMHKGCVGVFVQVDLVTQDYRPVKWIRLIHVDTPPMDCGCIALTQRKKYLLMNAPHHQKPNFVLYPDVIAIHNIAVRRQKAVASISARDMPVVLSYM